MENPDYKTMFADEQVRTVIVVRDGVGDVRMNEADFDPAKDKLSPNSHRIPANYVAPVVETPVAASAAKVKSGNAGKPATAAPAAPATAPNPDRYTIAEGGKFFLVDKDGKKMNETPFDSVEAAAAAPITVGV